MNLNFSSSRRCANIWIMSFKSQLNNLTELERLLSTDEIRRANDFAFEHLRNQFVVCRGTLRKILSTYLKFAPQEIRFNYSNYGKPFIQQCAESKIEFNISHSGEYFAIAVADGFPVGVDIEYCNTNTEILKIAEDVYSANEIEKLLSLPNEKQIHGFFDLWTAKEAFIKALGTGFSFDPKWIETDEFSQSFIPLVNEDQMIDPLIREKNLRDWYFIRYFFIPNYAFAIVSPFKDLQVHFHFERSSQNLSSNSIDDQKREPFFF